MISVIVPIYNVENYLQKCIDSIINQTYKNLEIILVDDGSPDNCGRMCDVYALKDDRIKIIHKNNGGLSDARNVGLDAAAGDYIGFIDSDDSIHREFYEVLINLIFKYNADIAQCGFLRVNEDAVNNFNEDKPYADEKITLMSNCEALDNLYNENYVNTVIVCNKLYKRELFEDTRFPKGKTQEDEFTTYKLLFSAKKVVSTSRQMYYYMKRTGSIMGCGFNIEYLLLLDAYCEQILFYKQEKLPELEKKAKIAFENYIRITMVDDLKSDLDNKDQIFDNLINYYRNNYGLFSSYSNTGFKKKVIMSLFNYSPRFIVVLLCNLMHEKYIFDRGRK